MEQRLKSVVDAMFAVRGGTDYTAGDKELMAYLLKRQLSNQSPVPVTLQEAKQYFQKQGREERVAHGMVYDGFHRLERMELVASRSEFEERGNERGWFYNHYPHPSVSFMFECLRQDPELVKAEGL